MAYRLDLKTLSEERRRGILAANPHLKPEDVGLPPEVAPQDSDPKPKTKARARKAWRGSISFDSETEARIYDRLCAEHVAVIAHGKIALSYDRHMEPDFIIVHNVDDDGRFEGELADAKGVWQRKTKMGKTLHKPHAEKDWRVKAAWLLEKFGLIVRVLTK